MIFFYYYGHGIIYYVSIISSLFILFIHFWELDDNIIKLLIIVSCIGVVFEDYTRIVIVGLLIYIVYQLNLLIKQKDNKKLELGRK